MVIASECAPSAPKSISNLPVIVVPSNTVAELSASIVGTSSFTLTFTSTCTVLPLGSVIVTITVSTPVARFSPCPASCIWLSVIVYSNFPFTKFAVPRLALLFSTPVII